MKTINRNYEFAKNTIILLIGKFSTQFITFLFLPLYTYFLSADDYGYVDLIQTYIVLFVPIITLRIDSAVFRFLIDCRSDEDEKKSVITNSIFIMVLGCIFTVIAGLIIICFFDFKYKINIIINIVVLLISNVLLQVLRGLGKNIDYSIASIITAIFTFVTTCLFIIIFKCGANSILISTSIANLICIFYIIIRVDLIKYLKFKSFDRRKIRKIISYSFPMIPNALSWWVVNVSDRTIISFFLGSAFNGIYAISCKFSNILNGVFSIVNMSWQELASLHVNDDDRNEYFSETISKIFWIFASISLLIIAILPLCYNIIIGKDFYDSYRYIPMLLYANLINVLSCLIGSIYIALKRTKEIAFTTIFSAILNIIINVVLIKKIGLYAAIASTLISYFVIFIYRYYDIKKYINIKFDFISLFVFSIIFVIFELMYLSNIIIVRIINLICITITVLIMNRKYIKLFLKKIKSIDGVQYEKK